MRCLKTESNHLGHRLDVFAGKYAGVHLPAVAGETPQSMQRWKTWLHMLLPYIADGSADIITVRSA
jgi:hypothetical protein